MKMKFERGSKVEVLIRKKVLSGVWRSAEIVEDHGNNCSVQYNLHRTSPIQNVKKVAKEAIRPRPPTDSEINWSVGDVMEVFDDGYWRVARILDVMGGDRYFVRVIGSFDEFEVPRTSIRVRKNWQDNRWVVIGKEYGNRKDRLSEVYVRKKEQKGDDHTVTQNTFGNQMSYLSYLKLKRTSPDSSNAEGCGNVQKRRAVEKRETCDRILGDASSCIKKVDVACFADKKQDEIFAEKFISRTTTCRFSKANDSDSDTSSVGSCSVITVSDEHDSSLPGLCQNDGALSSDAESSKHFEVEGGMCDLYLGQEYVTGIHMLELNSYRITLESLHKLGPLSWELEGYLTNLRSKLHITDDEHLNEDNWRHVAFLPKVYR